MALKRWIRTDVRWKRNGACRWSPEMLEIRLTSSPKGSAVYIYSTSLSFNSNGVKKERCLDFSIFISRSYYESQSTQHQSCVQKCQDMKRQKCRPRWLTSHTLLVCYRNYRVIPSGRFPSEWERPLDSLVVRKPVEVNDLACNHIVYCMMTACFTKCMTT